MNSDLFPVPVSALSTTKVTNEQYLEMYQQSVDDNEGFWREQGKRLHWSTPYTDVKDVSFDKTNHRIRWSITNVFQTVIANI